MLRVPLLRSQHDEVPLLTRKHQVAAGGGVDVCKKREQKLQSSCTKKNLEAFTIQECQWRDFILQFSHHSTACSSSDFTIPTPILCEKEGSKGGFSHILDFRRKACVHSENTGNKASQLLWETAVRGNNRKIENGKGHHTCPRKKAYRYVFS